jgi:hypothetical protein
MRKRYEFFFDVSFSFSFRFISECTSGRAAADASKRLHLHSYLPSQSTEDGSGIWAAAGVDIDIFSYF